MQSSLYLFMLFDEDKEAVPSNARWEYVEKNRWQSLAHSDVIVSVEMNNISYTIVRRRSFSMGGLVSNTMVLVMDIKKVSGV